MRSQLVEHLVRVLGPACEGRLGQPEDLRRAEAEAEDVVEIEVVQLVGADEVFRLLGDLAVLGGQQLGGDGGVEDVQQHPAQLGGGGDVGLVPDEVAHQRLGDTGVDAVHAHVVAVVGGPAQRQLGEVASADDEAAGAVGRVHQLEGAHAGLSVLKGDVQHAARPARCP